VIYQSQIAMPGITYNTSSNPSYMATLIEILQRAQVVNFKNKYW